MSVLSLLLVAISPTLDAVIPPPQPRLPQAESMRSMPKAELFDRPVKPRGNMPALFGTDDYPLDALRNLEEGTVGVIIKIDERGRVADCLVEYSSESSSLDAQTCRILWLRARFEPARGKSGKQIESALRQRIRWQIPEPEPVPISPWSSRIILTLAKGGAVMSCKWQRNGVSKIDEGACGFFAVVPSQYLAPFMAGATADVSTVYMDNRFLPGEMTEQTAADPKTDLLGRQVIRVTIDPVGKISRCNVAESVGFAANLPNGCLELEPWQYEMPTTKAGLPTSLDATIIRELRRSK